MQNVALWKRLQAFRFDAEDGSAPYSVKLAAEEGWDRQFTARVIEEYRKFLYLTQVSGAQATPSVAVDRAWHMHLTFTHSYWDKLCGEVLLAPLHHEPCIGEEEMPRYEDQYEMTKALYLADFGHAPPADIWPGDAPARRTDMRAAAAVALLAGGVLVALTGAFGAEGEVRLFALFLVGVGVAMVMGGSILLPDRYRFRARKRKGSGGSGVGGCGGAGRDFDDAGGCGGGCGGGGCGGG